MGISEGDPQSRFRGRFRRGINPLKKWRKDFGPRLEEHEREKRYGIMAGDLTTDVFIGIVAVYDSVAGTNKAEYYRTHPAEVELKIKPVLQGLIISGDADWRFKSSLSENSKLSIMPAGLTEGGDRLLKFNFEPQEDTENGDSEEGKDMQAIFRSRLEKYLSEQGLAVELRYPHTLG